MPYGRIKVDNISFTDGGADKDISISGLVKNPTFTGNVTATGTISGDVIRGGTTISGVTVTGTTANFTSGNFSTQVSGAIVKSPAGTAGTPSLQVGTGASVSPGLYGAGTDELGISTGGGSRVVVDSVGQVRVVGAGSAGSPAIVAGNDIDTGLYSSAANELAISTSGTEKLRINSSGAVGISGANYGTSGQVFTSNGPNGAPSWQDGSTAVNVQQFTSNGTWNKPAGVTYVLVEIWGGGGGGGSGRRGATNTARSAGGGGGGGGYLQQTFMATGLTSTVSVTVGAGGAGGTAITVNDTSGNTGTSGGTSLFGTYITGNGGGGGNAGTSGGGASQVVGGYAWALFIAAGQYDYNGGAGGGSDTNINSNLAGVTGGFSLYGGPGGAGGGSTTTGTSSAVLGYTRSGGKSLFATGGRGGLCRELNVLSYGGLSFNGCYRALAYGNSTYVMQGSSGYLIASTNLSTWTVYATRSITDFKTILFDGTKWVALAAGYDSEDDVVNNGIWTSTNLSDWTLQATLATSGPNRLAYNGGTYVVVGTGSYIVTSTDLVNWTARTAAGNFNDIIYDGSRWIAGGNTTGGTSGIIYTSTNASTWTAGGIFNGSSFTRIASNNAGTIVAAYGNNSIRYSTDTGTTWSSTGVTVSGTISTTKGGQIIYAESKFIHVGSGYISSSTDGITWTARITGTTQGWDGVVYNGTDFFASATVTGSPSSGITSIGNGSTDGLTWSGALTWTAYASSGEAGANGSGIGAGGGGGGASPNGFNSGAGGNGTDGFVRVTSW
jgi:hypothetical protein